MGKIATTRPRVLISLGRQQRWTEKHGRQPARLYEFELLVDRDRPSERWARFPGSPQLVSLTPHSGGENEVLDRFTVPRRPREPQHYPAAGPDRVERPNPTPQQRAVAAAMFERPSSPSDPVPVRIGDPCDF